MLKCSKCKGQTHAGMPTGLFLVKKRYTDKDGIEHIDIVSSKKVCMNCRGEVFI